MALKPQLDAVRNAFVQSADPRIVRAMDRATAVLAGSGIVADALKAGDVAPDFDILDRDGAHVTLSDLLAHGPVVLSFNRGDWCPYCAAEIDSLEGIRKDIEALDGTLVTLSPQLDGSTGFVDPRSRVAETFGIAFTVDGELRAAYERMGLSLTAQNGGDEWRLPLPATYVIGRTGRIALAFIDADHCNRLEPGEVVAALAALNRRQTEMHS